MLFIKLFVNEGDNWLNRKLELRPCFLGVQIIFLKNSHVRSKMNYLKCFEHLPIIHFLNSGTFLAAIHVEIFACYELIIFFWILDVEYYIAQVVWEKWVTGFRVLVFVVFSFQVM